jgi:hypothetical protein
MSHMPRNSLFRGAFGQRFKKNKPSSASRPDLTPGRLTLLRRGRRADGPARPTRFPQSLADGVRIRYMTEVKARPPTFALFGNQSVILCLAQKKWCQAKKRIAKPIKPLAESPMGSFSGRGDR